ncbi:Family 5 carbohydrate esterase [Fusarium albosuccineum]|uniref:Family 5 carbohydrate esterase n=1 Tax=Fusarium albosuccineum TaxID=1237068 RepID=A0A8H4P763_9HYPO|nr:Family 5 carbohydrate esterase [Fusarium albosuccineum]
MFQIALQRILANNTEARSQSVIYPAGFDQNVTSGVQNVIDIIKYGQKDCPNQKYFLFGYSQGATVVQKALNKLDNEALGAVNSVVLVGNPYRIPGRRSNLDNYGHLDNRTVYGLFAAHSLQSNGSIPTYNENLDRSGRVIDICLDNDIVCAIDPKFQRNILVEARLLTGFELQGLKPGIPACPEIHNYDDTELHFGVNIALSMYDEVNNPSVPNITHISARAEDLEA